MNTNCTGVRAQLPLLLYGELSFDEEETVESHLDVCVECRKALEQERVLSAAYDQVSVEPSPALLRECRENLFTRLETEPVFQHSSSLWERFLASFTIPVSLRPAGAVAMLVVGFMGARLAPGVLPGLGNSSSIESMDLANFGGRARPFRAAFFRWPHPHRVGRNAPAHRGWTPG
ncbi:MAG: zf-HC2 domain-containing protein [Acidobacteriota bacterium]